MSNWLVLLGIVLTVGAALGTIVVDTAIRLRLRYSLRDSDHSNDLPKSSVTPTSSGPRSASGTAQTVGSDVASADSDSHAVVHLSDLTLELGGLVVLARINLSLSPGEPVFLVGPSGAGKTVLLKVLSGEFKPTAGEVWVNGRPVHLLRPRQIALLRSQIGMLFQSYELLPYLTALANVEMAVRIRDLRATASAVHELSRDALDAVGLADQADKYPAELSGGQQQRIALARAVVTQPNIVLADEPTGNLDRETSWHVVEILDQIARFGTTVIMTTHNLEFVRRVGWRTISLVDGQIVRDQPAKQMENEGRGVFIQATPPEYRVTA